MGPLDGRSKACRQRTDVILVNSGRGGPSFRDDQLTIAFLRQFAFTEFFSLHVHHLVEFTHMQAVSVVVTVEMEHT